MKEAPGSSETSVLKEPHGVTTQKTPFFIVIAVKTSNLTVFGLVTAFIRHNWNYKACDYAVYSSL
jgi:hypothetical protein